MRSQSLIAERAVGKYPLSIATSLAIEGILGEHPDRPTNRNDLKHFNVVWINLRTLFRNFYNALPKEAEGVIAASEFVEPFVMEIDQLFNVLQTESKNNIKVNIYNCTYSDIERLYPKAIIRRPSTPNQIEYNNVQNTVTHTVSKFVLKDLINAFDTKIKVVEQSPTLLLSHCAVDLFNRGFKKMCLWESHTGAVKEKFEWYTKYYNGKELFQIPFHEGLIQIFGDNEHFRPQSLVMKRAILQVANDYGWSQATTDDKISYGIGQIEDRELRKRIRDIVF